MTGCAVGDCKYSDKNHAPPEAMVHVPKEVGFRLHKFPNRDKNKSTWDAWLVKTGRLISNFRSLENLRMCSVHFTPDMYKEDLIQRLRQEGRKVANNVSALLPSAIPTLRLPISCSNKTLSGSSLRALARKEKKMLKER
jgi:THAP domain